MYLDNSTILTKRHESPNVQGFKALSYFILVFYLHLMKFYKISFLAIDAKEERTVGVFKKRPKFVASADKHNWNNEELFLLKVKMESLLIRQKRYFFPEIIL